MFADDETRLKHMRDAAQEAIAFCNGRTSDDLRKDRQLALAVIKSIEIIGEAASGVGELFRDEHPEIPWRAIVGMRNRLVHGYFDIDTDRVWATVSENLPPLLSSLDSILT